jgi:hypothetical protein
MNLTTAQQTALHADIVGRANLAAFVTAMDWPSIANFYNGPSTAPATNVWLNNVSVTTLNTAIQWLAYEGLTPALQNTYLAMTQTGTVDMSDKGTARGIVGLATFTDGVFVDSSTSSLAIRAASVRTGTIFEVLFSALGTGTLGTVGAVTVGNVCQKDALGNSLLGQQLDPTTVQHVMGQ